MWPLSNVDILSSEIARESRVDFSSMKEKIGTAFFFAFVILGTLDAASPTPMYAKKGMKVPMKTV